jgi:excisionase family DNA binding protein
MSQLRGAPDPVFAPGPETEDIKRLEAMLERAHAKLVGMDGEEIPLPDSIYQVLRQVTHMMAAGQVISLVPRDHYLSTQDAADILNVSRPYLYTLLNRGDIPYTMVGTHRRIRVEDLMRYKHNRDEQRRDALDHLTTLSQDLGFYQADSTHQHENQQ